MKVSNKRELQQIPFSHLSDIDFQDFDITLASDNSSCFRESLLQRT